MPPLPGWLPPLLDVNPWTANTFSELAEVYKQSIATAGLTLNGCRVWYYRDTEDEHEVMFWHLTHRDDKETGERLPDPDRCQKLSWVAAIITNAHQAEVTTWDYVESDGNTNTYLWLKDHDCLVILRKYPDGARRIITAYHVDSGTRRSLEKKYQKKVV